MDLLRNARTGVLLALIIVVFCIATFVTVQLAKGGLEPSNSNTPNATVPGPPPFKS